MATHNFLVADPWGYNSIRNIPIFPSDANAEFIEAKDLWPLYACSCCCTCQSFWFSNWISPNLEDCPLGGGFGFLIVFFKSSCFTPKSFGENDPIMTEMNVENWVAQLPTV